MDDTMNRGWTGDLLIGSAFALFRGVVADDTEPHKHYASQLVYGEEDTVQIERASGAAELAATTGLSRSRFMALFSHELGIPVRHYILWIRLKQAAASICTGATITQAAHDAGFSD